MNYIRKTWQRLTGTQESDRSKSGLKERYAYFQRLLQANNQVLTLMADMEEKLSGDFLFDFEYIRATVQKLVQETSALVTALNGLGGNQYQPLIDANARISQEIENVLTNRREIPHAPPVMFFNDLDATKVEMVGGKNANLGEMRTRVEVPVPNGFAITSYSYKIFLDYNNITQRITEMLSSWRMSDLDSLGRVSEELKETIYAARMPPELETALQAAYEQLSVQEKCCPFLACTLQRHRRRS